MEMSPVWVSCCGSTWAVMQTSSVGLSVGMAFLLHHSNKCFKLPNYVLLENELVKKCASLSDLPAIGACWGDSGNARVWPAASVLCGQDCCYRAKRQEPRDLELKCF